MPLLIAIAVLGTWIGFANPLFQFPPAVIGLPLGLCWVACRAHTTWKSLRLGWFASWLACLGVIWWIALPIHQYGGLPWYLAGPCPLLVAGVLALYPGAWCGAMHYAARRLPPWAVILAGGVFWLALEHVGSWMFTGFPWVSMASALADWPWAVQAASLVGGYGLAGILAALATAVVLWNAGRAPKLIGLGLLVFLGIFGPVRMALYTPVADTADVLLVQGDVDQSVKWDQNYQVHTVEHYAALSQLGLEQAPADLLVWPETAMPFYLQDFSPLTSRVLEFVRAAQVWLVAGSPAYVTNPADNTFQLYNRAFLFNPKGQIQASYDKVHLVPFGEYVPLADILPLEKLAHGAGDYTPGHASPAMPAGPLRLGGLICYEAIFPDLAQARAESGATLLVNISNDAWFGHTPAPRQHLGHARVRCVEQGLAMARATNNGITVAIDPLGRITGSIPQFEAATLSARVEVRGLKTVFHRCYNILIPGAYLLSLAIFLAAWLAGRKRTRL